MMRLVLAIALACLCVASANNHVFFTRTTVPGGWTRGAVARPETKVSFMVALHTRNAVALENLFWAVSTPGSPSYQKYLTQEEVISLVAPDAANRDPVIAWLAFGGCQKVVDYKQAVECHTNVKTASKLLKTKFHVYKHEDGRQVVLTWGPASYPESLKKMIHFVEGITNFPVPHLRVHAPNDNYAAIPQTFTTLYSVPLNSASAPNPAITYGVIEFEQQSYSPANLATYSTDTSITVTPVTAADTVGPNDPNAPQIEAELDIQMITTVNNGSTAWFWLEQGNNWLYNFGVHFTNTTPVPQVISISYAWSEMDQCQINPSECQQFGGQSAPYVTAVNQLWQQIGVMGVSMLVASGDSGTNGRTDPTCTLPYLKPDFPACSPYVTSVGATQLNNAQTNLPNPPSICNQGYQCLSGGQEVAVSYDVASFASGGGFSTMSPAPSYNAAITAAYLNQQPAPPNLPPASYFNASNRGFPDVAAIGHDCLIFSGGPEPVGGTSCATPIFASIVALLNTALVAKGKPRLGFLNPFLYQMAKNCPTCFTDITVGDNICTEDGCSPGCQGFTCTPGWDPVTGLGTPVVSNMLAYVNKMF